MLVHLRRFYVFWSIVETAVRLILCWCGKRACNPRGKYAECVKEVDPPEKIILEKQ